MKSAMWRDLHAQPSQWCVQNVCTLCVSRQKKTTKTKYKYISRFLYAHQTQLAALFLLIYSFNRHETKKNRMHKNQQYARFMYTFSHVVFTKQNIYGWFCVCVLYRLCFALWCTRCENGPENICMCIVYVTIKWYALFLQRIVQTVHMLHNPLLLLSLFLISIYVCVRVY